MSATIQPESVSATGRPRISVKACVHASSLSQNSLLIRASNLPQHVGLAGAQAVEHCEIARYGTLRDWAALLGYDEAIPLIDETLGQ